MPVAAIGPGAGISIKEADPNARNVVVLDGIPGAHARAVESLRRGRAGESIALNEF